MATTIVMPKMGYDMREGTVVRWYKQEGEDVARGEVIADIETDKATVEFEAYTGGVLHRRVAQEGIPVAVGGAIAIIAEPGEALGEESADSPAAPQESSASEADSGAVQAATAAQARQDGEVRASPIARRLAREKGIDLALIMGSGPGGRIVEKDVLEYVPSGDGNRSNGWVRASPLARRLARERGIELGQVSGTGPEGRIVEEDILSFAVGAEEVEAPAIQVAPTAVAETTPEAIDVLPAEAPATAGADRIELSRMRQAIARVTVDSKRQAPHFYVTADIDMGNAMELRREVNDALLPEGRVSVNDLVVRACAIALGKHPKFNAFFQEDHLQFNRSINIGIAISLESGLIVPGISDCGNKSLAEIAASSKDLIERANSGSLRNEEYSGTTFSISNLGMFDVDSFAAIIFPPHAAVLAVGTIKGQPVVRDGQLAVGQVMKATLSTDHRVADGAEAARFLVEVKGLLEKPISLLI